MCYLFELVELEESPKSRLHGHLYISSFMEILCLENLKYHGATSKNKSFQEIRYGQAIYTIDGVLLARQLMKYHHS